MPRLRERLHVTRLHCNTCGTTIEGEFNVGRFAHLGRDQMLLLEGFLRSRGNLRELERELGVSYPTIRGRVENLLRALGLGDGQPSRPPSPQPRHRAATGVDSATRRSVLERLARKEITAEQAAALLRGETAPTSGNRHRNGSPPKQRPTPTQTKTQRSPSRRTARCPTQEALYSPAEIRHRIGATGTFSLNNVSGDIRIRAADTDEVVVRARWDGGGGDRPLPLVVRRTDSSLHIDIDEQRRLVRLPQPTAASSST